MSFLETRGPETDEISEFRTMSANHAIGHGDLVGRPLRWPSHRARVVLIDRDISHAETRWAVSLD